MTKLSEKDCALIRGNPFYRNTSFEKRAVETIDALRGELADVQNERKLCIPLHEAVAEKDKAIARLLAPNPSCPSGHPMACWVQRPPQKDSDGHCEICGYKWEDERETLEPHVCPPGFAMKSFCTLCVEKEAAIAAALDSFKAILDRMSDAPIPDGTCSNADQEEGYHDGICCAFNFIYKELRALTPTQTSAHQERK